MLSRTFAGALQGASRRVAGGFQSWSGHADKLALFAPAKRQAHREQVCQPESGRLPTFENRPLDVRSQERQTGKLAQVRIAESACLLNGGLQVREVDPAVGQFGVRPAQSRNQ